MRACQPRILTLSVMLALSGTVVAQDFTLRPQYARISTAENPNGIIDNSQPYTVCNGLSDRVNTLQLRLLYTWRKDYQDYAYTEPVGSFFPFTIMGPANPNPVFLSAAQPGNPTTRTVDIGLSIGPVNNSGIRQYTFRGRTLGAFGPTLTANMTVTLENLPNPAAIEYYAVLPDNVRDMPTRPFFSWKPTLGVTGYRFDVAQCSSQDTQNQSCGNSPMPFEPNGSSCAAGTYCWVGDEANHQLPIALTPNTAYEWRALGRNVCGVSDEVEAEPVRRPFFRTAQACFSSGQFIPDGGSLSVDVTTAANQGALTPNLRVTVHTDHSNVGDLRMSLSQVSPALIGPVVLMDPPVGVPGGNSCDGRRLQAVFGQAGAFPGASCKPYEPAIGGRLAAQGNIASFNAAQGNGNWRLTIDDTVANGRSGQLIEWCLSADVPVTAAPFQADGMMLDGFEPRQ